VLLLDLGVFPVGSESRWTEFFHFIFFTLVVSIDIVYDLDLAFP